MTKNIKLALIFTLVITLGVLFYFLYWTKTPAYSLQLIRTSIEKHDLVTFEKHVDIDTLMSHGFDDFLKSQVKNEDDLKMAQNFAAMIKPGFVDALKNALKEYVQTGASDDKKEGKETPATAVKNKTKLDSLQYKSSSTISKEGKNAVVEILFHDPQLSKDFALKLRMTELEDRTWRLVQLENLADFIIQREKAQEEKLAELNQPIAKELASYIETEKPSIQVVSLDSWGINKAAQIAIPMTFPQEKKIVQLYGKIDIFNGNVLLATKSFHATGSTYAGKKIVSQSNISLNPFIGGDSAIIKAPPQDLSATFTLMGLQFEDGSVIEFLNELPPLENKKK